MLVEQRWVDVETCGYALVVGTLQDTFLTIVAYTDTIRHRPRLLVDATCQAYIVLLADAITIDLVLPVGVVCAGSIVWCAVCVEFLPVKSSDEQFKNWGGYWQWTLPTTAYDPTFKYALNDDAPVNPVEKVEHYDFYKSAHILMGNVEADYKIHGFEDLHLHVCAGSIVWCAVCVEFLPT